MKLLMMVAAVVVSATSIAAQGAGPGQGRQGRQGLQGPGAAAPGDNEASITPAEIQRMFDAYALLQAQQHLQISDDQYTRFLTRFKALQDIRRKSLQEHTRIIVELGRLLREGQPAGIDDAQLKERMQALQDLDARSSAEIRKAYDAIDQVLDVKQQAKFRVFEELMERRKLDLVTRARQANRPRSNP